MPLRQVDVMIRQVGDLDVEHNRGLNISHTFCNGALLSVNEVVVRRNHSNALDGPCTDTNISVRAGMVTGLARRSAFCEAWVRCGNSFSSGDHVIVGCVARRCDMGTDVPFRRSNVLVCILMSSATESMYSPIV